MNQNPQTDPYIEFVKQQSIINGRYTNLNRIGQGQFSFVMRADDKQSDNAVAIKFLHPNVQEVYRRQCFEREAKILGQLDGQKNILPLVEGLSTFNMTLRDNQISFPVSLLYFVIALAQSSLKDYIYEGSATPTISLRYFREVCKGVQRLHNLRYCHRDLKPDNFLISKRLLPSSKTSQRKRQTREIWLSDFGTARSLSDSAERFLQSYDFPVGDLRYAPVELWCGLGNYPEMFYAADVFGLGAILFEMFTQSILTEYVFDRGILGNLLDLFRPLTAKERKDTFDKMLKSITAQWRLPDIQDLASDLPSPIAERINRLYKQLAHLDYRKRMSRKDASGRLNFTPVFQEIDRCLKILEHQKAYEKLQARKRIYAENAKKKAERRQKRMAGGYES